jgi:hypothetical protein
MAQLVACQIAGAALRECEGEVERLLNEFPRMQFAQKRILPSP